MFWSVVLGLRDTVEVEFQELDIQLDIKNERSKKKKNQDDWCLILGDIWREWCHCLRQETLGQEEWEGMCDFGHNSLRYQWEVHKEPFSRHLEVSGASFWIPFFTKLLNPYVPLYHKSSIWRDPKHPQSSCQNPSTISLPRQSLSFHSNISLGNFFYPLAILTTRPNSVFGEWIK